VYHKSRYFTKTQKVICRAKAVISVGDCSR